MNSKEKLRYWVNRVNNSIPVENSGLHKSMLRDLSPEEKDADSPEPTYNTMDLDDLETMSSIKSKPARIKAAALNEAAGKAMAEYNRQVERKAARQLKNIE